MLRTVLSSVSKTYSRSRSGSLATSVLPSAKTIRVPPESGGTGVVARVVGIAGAVPPVSNELPSVTATPFTHVVSPAAGSVLGNPPSTPPGLDPAAAGGVVMGGSTAGCPAAAGADFCGEGAEFEHAPTTKIAPNKAAGGGNRPGRRPRRLKARRLGGRPQPYGMGAIHLVMVASAQALCHAIFGHSSREAKPGQIQGAVVSLAPCGPWTRRQKRTRRK